MELWHEHLSSSAAHFHSVWLDCLSWGPSSLGDSFGLQMFVASPSRGEVQAACQSFSSFPLGTTPLALIAEPSSSCQQIRPFSRHFPIVSLTDHWEYCSIYKEKIVEDKMAGGPLILTLCAAGPWVCWYTSQEVMSRMVLHHGWSALIDQRVVA